MPGRWGASSRFPIKPLSPGERALASADLCVRGRICCFFRRMEMSQGRLALWGREQCGGVPVDSFVFRAPRTLVNCQQWM